MSLYLSVLISLVITSAIAYWFYRKGWHRSRVFTDPKVRRWYFLGFTVLEATSIPNWWAILATIMFGGFFVFDCWAAKKIKLDRKP